MQRTWSPLAVVSHRSTPATAWRPPRTNGQPSVRGCGQRRRPRAGEIGSSSKRARASFSVAEIGDWVAAPSKVPPLHGAHTRSCTRSGRGLARRVQTALFTGCKPARRVNRRLTIGLTGCKLARIASTSGRIAALHTVKVWLHVDLRHGLHVAKAACPASEAPNEHRWKAPRITLRSQFFTNPRTRWSRPTGSTHEPT